MERRNEFFGVSLAQGLWADVFSHQKFKPVEKLGRGGLFLHARYFADLIK
jgi:hypothetical protein